MSNPHFPQQLIAARKYRQEHGREALMNPHGLIGRQCRCMDCFCCAALRVGAMTENAFDTYMNGAPFIATGRPRPWSA